MRIDGLQEFGEQAKKFLTHAIHQWYPENFNDNDSKDSGESKDLFYEEIIWCLEQRQMTTFLLNKTLICVDRIGEFAMLMMYITGDHEDFTVIDGKFEHSFQIFFIHVIEQEQHRKRRIIKLY